MLTLEGAEWKNRRTKLSPIFTSGKMKVMFEILDAIGERFMTVIDTKLKENESLEMRDYAGKFTADVIGS